jgi:RNA polymerase sigma-70 factor (ECF subfamily)
MTNTALKPAISEETPLWKIVADVQAGSSDAFSELYKRTHRAAFGMVLPVLRDPDKADDVVQDVFLQVARKIGQLRNPHAFVGWLKQSARRIALNHLKRDQRRTPRVGDGRSREPRPDCAVIDAETSAVVRAAIGRLNELDRSTLAAHYFDGLSVEQMAERTGAPVGTIKRRLHVARHRLAGVMPQDAA